MIKLSAIFLLLLIGCDFKPMKDESTNTIKIDYKEIKEITLSDGTKCAVGIIKGGISGISCNWKKE